MLHRPSKKHYTVWFTQFFHNKSYKVREASQKNLVTFGSPNITAFDHGPARLLDIQTLLVGHSSVIHPLRNQLKIIKTQISTFALLRIREQWGRINISKFYNLGVTSLLENLLFIDLKYKWEVYFERASFFGLQCQKNSAVWLRMAFRAAYK